MNKKVAGLYLRVSSESQVKGTSLESQDIDLKAYANTNDIEIYKVYADKGISGKLNDEQFKTLMSMGYSGIVDDRPALKELLIDAESGLIDMVLVYKFDRFSRDLIFQEIVIRQLQSFNVEIVSITEDNSKMIRRFIGTVSENEVETLENRAKKGQLQRAKQGFHLARAPFGYTFDRHGDLHPNTDAGKVRHIFQTCVNRTGKNKANISKIAKAYNISRHTVYNILNNSIYRGIITYKGVEYRGRHEAIIKSL